MSASFVSALPPVAVDSSVVFTGSFVVWLKGFLRDFRVFVWLTPALSILENGCAVFVHHSCSGLGLLLSLFLGNPVEGVGSFCLLS